MDAPGFSADAGAAILAGLNPEQRAAAAHDGRVLLILAGAGSGKTRTLTRRIAHGVATGRVRPSQILAVTFSNRAAHELRERIAGLLGGGLPAARWGPGGWLGITFHAAGLRILREAARDRHPDLPLAPNFTIYADDDQDGVLRRVLKGMGLPADRRDARAYRSAISRDKGAGVGPHELERSLASDQLRHYGAVYDAYERHLRAANAADFGDLLLWPMRLLRDDEALRARLHERFRWILVDEFQDTNDVQMALVRLLFGPATSLAVVGDDDQSIYRWRGARVDNILDFPTIFDDVEVVHLERNYRSTGHILGAANALIAHNQRRHPKRLWTDDGDGEKVVIRGFDDDRDEARAVARRVHARLRDLPPGAGAPAAIFYRTHAQSMLIEEALRGLGIAHRVYGGLRFYDRKEIKDALAYARLVVNPADDEAFLRIVNVPARRIGPATLKPVLEGAAAAGGGGLLAAARAVVSVASGGAARRLAGFVHLIDELGAGTAGLEAGAAIEDLVVRSGLKRALEEDPSPDAEARVENLGALVNAAWDFSRAGGEVGLGAFLERLTLRAATDELDADAPHVALMTLHNAKGLEYDHVVVVGVEEGLVPHFNSLGPGEDEEERRLLYVGMTRARQSLLLTYARRRQRFGSYATARPSSFLSELDEAHVERAGEPRIARPSPAAAAIHAADHWADDHVDPHPIGDGVGASEAIGMRVRHPRFGRGRVVRVVGRPGPDAVVEVRFDQGAPRRILARFLEPC